MEYSPDALGEAGAAYRRIENFVERASRVVSADDGGVVCAEFAEALDNDLSVPGALAAIHNVVREGNAALAEARHDAVRGALSSVLAMTSVLGISPIEWAQESSSDLTRCCRCVGARGARPAHGCPCPQGLCGGRRDP